MGGKTPPEFGRAGTRSMSIACSLKVGRQSGGGALGGSASTGTLPSAADRSRSLMPGRGAEMQQLIAMRSGGSGRLGSPLDGGGGGIVQPDQLS
eukprot:3399187-Prymnesium_polylepis.1